MISIPVAYLYFSTSKQSPNLQRPLGISNTPMGIVPQPQPTLSAPYLLQKIPRPLLHPQFPAQPNPNPNNRLVQLVQIVKISDYEIEQK